MKQTVQGPVSDVVTGAAGPLSGTVIDLRSAGQFAVVSNITVDANAAGTFSGAAVTLNRVTITAHGYRSGLVGQLTTAGTLPTGLSAATNYYIIVIDANTVSFAGTYAQALSGTAIAISAGAGNSTFTAPALAGATVVGQWSLDGTLWINDAAPTSVTVPAQFVVKVDRPIYSFYRLTYAATSGSLGFQNKLIINRDV